MGHTKVTLLSICVVNLIFLMSFLYVVGSNLSLLQQLYRDNPNSEALSKLANTIEMQGISLGMASEKIRVFASAERDIESAVGKVEVGNAYFIIASSLTKTPIPIRMQSVPFRQDLNDVRIWWHTSIYS